MSAPPTLPGDLPETVARALAEDLGTGDLSACLVPTRQAEAIVVCREEAVLCGSAWFEQVFRQLAPDATCQWTASDGTVLHQGQQVCRLKGPATVLLSGERTALNFLQLLSGTATLTRRYVQAVAGTGVIILDTRKTVPGLRAAQKYAVACAGGHNHRAGLYDKVLMKENHISMLGGIEPAIRAAAAHHGQHYEIEVENLTQLQTALDNGATHVMLDNFTLQATRDAVRLNAGRAHLEVSGGITSPAVAARIAAAGVNSISVGVLTRGAPGIDFSMRLGN